jgi:rod shape determining protein RodA
VVVVGVYAVLLLRGWSIVVRAGGPTSRLVGAGVLAMLGFQMMVNLGMTLGLMPVTGVPLPFVSYGGSSMLVSMTSIGLLLGISARRDPLVF